MDYNITNESVIYLQLYFRMLDTKIHSEYSIVKPKHVSNTRFNADYVNTHVDPNKPSDKNKGKNKFNFTRAYSISLSETFFVKIYKKNCLIKRLTDQLSYLYCLFNCFES